MKRYRSIVDFPTKKLMYRRQRGFCGICGRHFHIDALVPDHNHSTGRIRGLLCVMCNRTEGDVAALRGATGRPIGSRIDAWIESDGLPDLQ